MPLAPGPCWRLSRRRAPGPTLKHRSSVLGPTQLGLLAHEPRRAYADTIPYVLVPRALGGEMAVHVRVSPQVLDWLVDRSGKDPDEFRHKYPRWDSWISGSAVPTMRQARELARAAGVPIGYLLLQRPPELKLPVPDFREGFGGDLSEPSSDLLAVVHQSIRRQDWYRDYAEDQGLTEVEAVGAGVGQAPEDVAAQMRASLNFEVTTRQGPGATFASICSERSRRLVGSRSPRPWSRTTPIAY